MARSDDYRAEAERLRNELSNLLVTARSGLGLSQRQVADLLGVTQVTVGRWESSNLRESPPPDQRHSALAKALRMRVGEIKTLCELLDRTQQMADAWRDVEDGEAAIRELERRWRGQR